MSTAKPVVESLEERFVPAANIADYVDGLYVTILHRDPDPQQSVWINSLNSGRMTREQAAFGVITSPEGKRVAVNDLYIRILGRHAEEAGLTAHVNLLNAGATYQAIQAGILASNEFFQIYGNNNNAEFLQGVYSIVFGRFIDNSGNSAWANLLNQGVSRNELVRRMQVTPEGHEQYVQDFYDDTLDRAADRAGLTNWVGKFAAGVRYETIQAQIISSDEFFNAG